MRLVQLVRTEKNSPLSSNLCPIINTLDHLILVLGNWSETPFFLQLQFHELNPASSEDVDQSNIESTVFDESIEELKYLKEILIGEVVDSIYYTITAKSLKYRTEVITILWVMFYVLRCRTLYNLHAHIFLAYL